MVPAILTKGPNDLGTLLYPVPSQVSPKVHGSITELQEASELPWHPRWLRTGSGENLVGDCARGLGDTVFQTPSSSHCHWAALLTTLETCALLSGLRSPSHPRHGTTRLRPAGPYWWFCKTRLPKNVNNEAATSSGPGGLFCSQYKFEDGIKKKFCGWLH